MRSPAAPPAESSGAQAQSSPPNTPCAPPAPSLRLDVGLQPTAVGGAVVDAQGRIVGIATPRFARFGAIAIPAPTVDRVIDTLLKKGHIPQGYLGVGLQPVRLPESL